MKLDNIKIVRDLDEKIAANKQLEEEYKIERKIMYNKLYLSEVVDIENPEFGGNNLILAPVGSGKSYLIENRLTPKEYNKDIIYLTSSTALKDSICPSESADRKAKAARGESLRYFTTQNKKRYGEGDYNVHVMTYHEFGVHLDVPANRDRLLENVGIVFCDEIHSLPIYEGYGGSNTLTLVRSWLFQKHKDIEIYYFTATKDSIETLDKEKPGTLNHVKIFDYLEYPNIRRYVVNSTVFVNHIEQIRPHLRMKLDAFNYYGYKGLAFTPKISEQRKIAKIAREEGFRPIALWSTNSESEKMTEEQKNVRTFLLKTGMIPEPYNLLIINGAMQEGWNLDDDMMRLAILDTTNVTEQVQALGRIRRNIDLLVCRTNEEVENLEPVELPKEYLSVELSVEDKVELYSRLNILDRRGRLCKWPTIKDMLEKEGYTIKDKIRRVDGKRKSFSVISLQSTDQRLV